ILPNGEPRPDASHQVILGNELTSRLNQDFQDLERAAAKNNGSVARPQLASTGIDLPRSASVDNTWVYSSGHPASRMQSTLRFRRGAQQNRAPSIRLSG